MDRHSQNDMGNSVERGGAYPSPNANAGLCDVSLD